MADIGNGHGSGDTDFHRDSAGHLEDEAIRWSQPTLALRPAAGSVKVVGGRRGEE